MATGTARGNFNSTYRRVGDEFIIARPKAVLRHVEKYAGEDADLSGRAYATIRAEGTITSSYRLLKLAMDEVDTLVKVAYLRIRKDSRILIKGVREQIHGVGQQAVILLPKRGTHKLEGLQRDAIKAIEEAPRG